MAQNAVLPQQLPRLVDLRTREVIELQFIFANQASTIQEAARNYLNGNQLPGVPDTQALNGLFNDYIAKAVALADKLQLHGEEDGDEAWSGGGLAKRSRAMPKPQTVPVTEVFQRILCDLPPATAATVDEVDATLHQLSLFGNHSHDITLVHPTSPTRVTPAPVDGSFVDLYQKARRLYVMEVPATGEQADMLGTGNGATVTIDRLSVIPHLGLEGSELAEPHSGSAVRVREMNELQRKDYNSVPVGKTLIDCLFVAPHAIDAEPQCQPAQRWRSKRRRAHTDCSNPAA